jgi:Smg protein
MFDILVYLYETYYRPDACPDQAVLVRKLSAVGFEEEEISKALGWLTDLAETAHNLEDHYPRQAASTSSTRVYAAQEMDMLGPKAIGFVQFLESAGMLTPVQRELVIERALGVAESPVPQDKLKVIVLMVLWSQGTEPEGLMFDELFLDEDEEGERRLLH